MAIDRSIPLKAKITAISMVIASFSFTVWQLSNYYAQIAMVLFGAALVLFLLQIPSTTADKVPQK